MVGYTIKGLDSALHTPVCRKSPLLFNIRRKRMVDSYDNTNRGSIWKNDRRETERHPHFTGVANVDGKEFYVSAWKRSSDANPKAPALTFSFKPKDGVVESTSDFKVAEEDEDIPW